MLPDRLSITTYNLWHTMRWPERMPALKQFVEVYSPDVLCVQELRGETQAFLDGALPRHRRIDDDFAGWTCEGNIYYNSAYLEEVEHGAEDIGILEPQRRLFWVRLQQTASGRTVFIATAHFTHQGHAEESRTGQSPRLDQTHRTIEALDRLIAPGEAALFAGDLNDAYLPIFFLQQAGYQNCFWALRQQCPPTWPCFPTGNVELGGQLGNQTLDWIFANAHARAVSASVPHVYCADIAPSDHWPVHAVYELP